MNSDKLNGQYEVLNPWAEADPIPLRGISPRLTDLMGKRVGLYCNYKRAARSILTVAEKILKEKFPTSETSWYFGKREGVPGIESEDRAEFEAWLKGVDAVIAAVGD